MVLAWPHVPCSLPGRAVGSGGVRTRAIIPGTSSVQLFSSYPAASHSRHDTVAAVTGGGGGIADFGCSNGFFFAELLRALPEAGAMNLFFREQSEADYVRHLLTGKSISVFRDPAADGWGQHLGFDWRVVLEHLNESNSCRVLRVASLIFGYIIVVRRT